MVKRSYRNHHNSLSGVVTIVGFYTGKVLYIGVRNRYCTMCAREESRDEEVKTHTCYKNWTSSSSSMEEDIIPDGFQESMGMYDVKYGTLIADGDSSVYYTMLRRPYDNLTVTKIECRNHML